MCGPQIPMMGAANYVSMRNEADAKYQQQMQEYYNHQARWEVQKKQADDQKRRQEASALLQLQELQDRQRGVNDAAALEKIDVIVTSLRAKAATELSKGEANVAGRSVDQLIASVEGEAQRKNASIETNRENQISELQAAKHSAVQGKDTGSIYNVMGDAPTREDMGSILMRSLMNTTAMSWNDDYSSLMSRTGIY